MLLHIYFWAIDNPVSIAEGEEHRLMLVSDRFPKEAEFVSGLGALITKGYKVLLVNDVEVPSITTQHTDWVWRSLFHGGYTRLCHHCGQAPEPKSQFSNFQMFEETAEPSTDAKTVAKTGIFWDLDDFRIPDCLNPLEVRDNIESALKKKGFLVDWAVFFIYYTEKLRWSDDLVHRYEDHGYLIFKDGEY